MADHFLVLTQQLAGKLESVAGVAETLTAAEVKLRPFQSEFGFSPEFQRFTNDQVADDIGVAADFVSGKAGSLRVGFPLNTSGVVGTAPACGIYLEAMAHKEQNVKTITIGAPTGGGNAFAAGDTFTATGGRTGIIEQDISAGGTLRYIMTAGADLADTVVITAPDGTSATCSGTSSAHSVKYTPTSFSQKTITVQQGEKNDAGTAGQDFLYRLLGAMGTGRLRFAALDAIRLSAEFKGPISFTGAGSLFTGVTYEAQTNATLPKLRNSTIQINGVSVVPSAIEMDFGAVVELDPDPTTGGGEDGYDQARIARREPKLTIDPRKLKPGTLDELGLLGDGTEFPISIICGTTPYLIEIAILKAQLREMNYTDRAGRKVINKTIHIVRNAITDNDYAIYFR